ncbi:MAG: sulfite exporter TauE/SafE family protein, partial [Mycobacterium sp.]
LIAGAAIGAFLLLHLPDTVFVRIVPVLLVIALVLVVLGPRIQAYARRRAEAAGRSVDHISPRRMAALTVGTFAIGVYGGYFTAAQGILLVGLMGALLPEDLQRMNAAKNLMSLLINIVAAGGYILVAFGRINWPVAGLISVGSLVGGWLGARYGRRLSPAALRVFIVIVGLIGLYRLLAL